MRRYFKKGGLTKSQKGAMKKDMKKGASFSESHKTAMKKVGK